MHVQPYKPLVEGPLDTTYMYSFPKVTPEAQTDVGLPIECMLHQTRGGADELCMCSMIKQQKVPHAPVAILYVLRVLGTITARSTAECAFLISTAKLS